MSDIIYKYLAGSLGVMTFEAIRLYRVATNKKVADEIYKNNKKKLYFVVMPLLVVLGGGIVLVINPESNILCFGIGYSLPAGSWHIFDLINKISQATKESNTEETIVDGKINSEKQNNIVTLVKRYLLS